MPKFSFMIWGCVNFNVVVTITVVDGNVTAPKYIDIIDEHLWPVVARDFPWNGIFTSFRMTMRQEIART